MTKFAGADANIVSSLSSTMIALRDQGLITERRNIGRAAKPTLALW